MYDQAFKVPIQGWFTADKLDAPTADIISLVKEANVILRTKHVVAACARPRFRVAMDALQVALIRQFKPQKIQASCVSMFC